MHQLVEAKFKKKGDMPAVASGDSHLNLDLCTNSSASASPHPRTAKEKTFAAFAFDTNVVSCTFFFFFLL